MGGCGGKKQRDKKKTITGPGGKFDSIGTQSQQSANLELVTRLMGEIGSDGEKMLALNPDRLFLQDCRIKINQMGGATAFGWRQVETIVRLHGEVQRRRQEERANAAKRLEQS